MGQITETSALSSSDMNSAFFNTGFAPGTTVLRFPNDQAKNPVSARRLKEKSFSVSIPMEHHQTGGYSQTYPSHRRNITEEQDPATERLNRLVSETAPVMDMLLNTPNT